MELLTALSLTTISSTTDMSYVGCYEQFPYGQFGTREMPYGRYEPASCAYKCRRFNLDYAWLSVYGRKCYCSKMAPKVESRLGEVECNDGCETGNTRLACGASNGRAFSVYLDTKQDTKQQEDKWKKVQLAINDFEDYNTKLNLMQEELDQVKAEMKNITSSLEEVQSLAQDKLGELSLCDQSGFVSNWTYALSNAYLSYGGDDIDSVRKIMLMVQDKGKLGKKQLEAQVLEAQIGSIREEIKSKEDQAKEALMDTITCTNTNTNATP